MNQKNYICRRKNIKQRNFEVMPIRTLATLFEKYPSLSLRWKGNDALHEEYSARPPHFTFDMETFKGKSFQQNNGTISDYQSEMECQEFSIPDGVHVMKARLQSATSGYIQITSARPYLHLYFAIHNNRSYYAKDSLLEELHPGEFQLYLFHQEELTAIWHTLPNDHFVEINIDLTFFESLLPITHPLSLKIDKLLDQKSSGALFTKAKQMNSHQYRILEELGQSSIQQNLLPLLTKAKLIELFAYILEEENINRVSATADSIPKEMQLLMEKAKVLLDKQKANPPSIAELAILLGTNENYLKKYFKLYHHMTIYGYVRHIRMQTAMDLLHKREKTINEISRFLGYTTPAHFSSSFKKHFGVKPKKIQQTIE